MATNIVEYPITENILCLCSYLQHALVQLHNTVMGKVRVTSGNCESDGSFVPISFKDIRLCICRSLYGYRSEKGTFKRLSLQCSDERKNE